MVIQLIGRRSTGDLETETACLKYYQTATLLDDRNFDLVKHFRPLGRGRAGQNCGIERTETDDGSGGTKFQSECGVVRLERSEQARQAKSGSP